MAFFKGCIVLNNGKVVRCNYTKIMDVPKDSLKKICISING